MILQICKSKTLYLLHRVMISPPSISVHLVKNAKKNIKSTYIQLILFSIFTQLLFSYNKISAQVEVADEYTIKGIFILRAINFVEWPKSSEIQSPKQSLTIGIYGNNPFEGKLKKIIETKKLKFKNKKIFVKNIKNPSEIKTTNILFISASEKYNLSKILKYTENYPILTIADSNGFSEKGVMINILIENGHLNFYVNKRTAEKQKIYISSQLLARAKQIIK